MSTTNDDVRNAVRERYATIARDESSCCEDTETGSCCGSAESGSCCDDGGSLVTPGEQLGYSRDQLALAPDAAGFSLGCGNPTAIASLQPGETVVDLGSGGGFDCFLAADAVGPEGRSIGVDMTSEMIDKARRNAEHGGWTNAEFRLGEIEHLPVGDSSVDVVMSNCVINLAPDKQPVYEEIFRVLKPGGRVAIADVVQTAEFPEALQRDKDLLTKCVAGAITIDAIEGIMREAGFTDVAIQPKDESRGFIREWSPDSGVEDYVVSALISGRKPE